MADSTEQERIERRRARRQQRILASAESRLNKITGNQSGFRESASPSPSPSTSTTSIKTLEEKNTLAEHYPLPNDPRRQKYEIAAVAERIATPPAQHRPAVQKIIEEDQARELNEHGFLGGKIPQLLLANMLRKTNNPIVTRKSRNPVNKYWNLLHFVSMIWLGFLAVYEEIEHHGLDQVSNLIKDPSIKENTSRHFPVFWYFVTLEIAIQFGRFIYQPEYSSINETSFANIASQLPESLQAPVYFLQKYGVILNGIFRDLCIVIFVIGFTCIIMTLAV